MIYSNEYGQVNFMDEYPELYERKKIGINLSGGVDSAFVMFMTLQKIIEKDLDVKVIPITGVDLVRPTNEWNAREIVDFFCEMFPSVHIEPHEVFYYRKAHQHDKITHHVKNENRLVDDEVIDALFHGISKNPPKEIMQSLGFYDKREKKRDKNTIAIKHIKKDKLIFYTPLHDVTKKFIAKEYKKFGLMDELFPITASCIEKSKKTNYFTEPCKECWWCKEKYWAFQMYDGGVQ